jgi:HD-like signal output (HDOD) protein
MQPLLKTSGDPNCGINDFASVIRQHPTVVAAILQVAKTAFLGAGGRVETIEEALQMLGIDLVRNLAITELAKKQLSLSPGLKEIANAVLNHCIETSYCRLLTGKLGCT